MEDKRRESRLRRMADRQGLMLRKCRRRDPGALDYGRYWLVEPSGNWLVAGGEYGIDLDDVEAWLRGGRG